MSRTATRLYTLSPEAIGTTKEERVPRELRKGVPDEYKQLLAKAEEDTNIMVEEQLDKAARIYIPKLYDCLIKNDLPPKSARSIITTDCCRERKMWKFQTVSKYLPEETKHPGRRKAGLVSNQVRTKKRKAELEQFVEEVKPIVQGIEDADEKTQKALQKLGKTKIVGLASPKVTSATKTRVATSGGNATKEKHPGQYSPMGLKSAEARWGYQSQQTLQLAINKEEHKEMVNAYEQSIEAGGGGCYTIYVKEGEFDRVEADLNGKPEKSVNK